MVAHKQEYILGQSSSEYYPSEQYPSQKDLDILYSDDELRLEETQWVACYIFYEQQDKEKASARLRELFPSLSNEEVVGYVSAASSWWQDKRDEYTRKKP